jgi:hypothetical protein
MKKIYISVFLLTSLISNAQTGIGTSTPKATLDVRASENVNSPEGIIAPQLTYDFLVAKNNAYGTEQKGAIVYVTTAPVVADTNTTSKTYEVTQPGYYYFNGTQWEKFAKDISAWNLNGNSVISNTFDNNASIDVFMGNGDTTTFTIKTLKGGTFLGTVNSEALSFKSNNKYVGYLNEGVISFGSGALSHTDNPSNNLIAIGRYALLSNTSGNNNIALGNRSLISNTKGTSNIAIGNASLQRNNTGNQNTAVGTNTANKLTGDSSTNNVAIGMSALMNLVEGSKNVAIGASTLTIADGDRTLKTDNTAVGYSALYNVFKGNLGIGNTALGAYAGVNVHGNKNIFIGSNVTFSSTVKESNENVRVEKSNKMNIGNVIFGANILSSDSETYKDSKGLVGIGAADPKAKLHITPFQMGDSDTSNKSNRLVSEVLIVEGLKPVADTRTVNMMVVDNDGLVSTKPISNSSTPQFFYMPSVLLPTNDTGTTNVTYTPAPGADTGTMSGTYQVDLHKVFETQFNTPIASSDSSTTGLSGFVLANDRYEYHVIYADTNVFKNIKVSNVGVLTYQVNREAIIRNGAFMNIVLKVK